MTKTYTGSFRVHLLMNMGVKDIQNYVPLQYRRAKNLHLKYAKLTNI